LTRIKVEPVKFWSAFLAQTGDRIMHTRRNSTYSRRDVLRLAGVGLGSIVASKAVLAEYRYLAPVSVANPLAA
jgi:hypothetical protein